MSNQFINRENGFFLVTGEVSVDKISSLIFMYLLYETEGDFDFFGVSFFDLKGIPFIK